MAGVKICWRLLDPYNGKTIPYAEVELETDTELNFLSKLSKSELETLVVPIRNRVENFGES